MCQMNDRAEYIILVEKARIVQEIKETSKSSSSRQEKVKALDDNHAEALLEFDRTFLNKLDHKVMFGKVLVTIFRINFFLISGC